MGARRRGWWPAAVPAAGLEAGARQQIKVRPQAMLEAKELPTCHLSDHLEARIAEAMQVGVCAQLSPACLRCPPSQHALRCLCRVA